jgi:hypothetical protein
MKSISKFAPVGGSLLAALILAGCAQNATTNDEPKPADQAIGTGTGTTKTSGQDAPTSQATTSAKPQAVTADDMVWTAAQASDLKGSWNGTVDCGKGAFELQLQISPYKGGPQMMGGLAVFKPAAGNKFRQGSSGFKGEVTKGDVQLRPNGIVQKSVNLPSVSMNLVARTGPDRLVGEFLESGCKSIDLRRPAPPVTVKRIKVKTAL